MQDLYSRDAKSTIEMQEAVVKVNLQILSDWAFVGNICRDFELGNVRTRLSWMLLFVEIYEYLKSDKVAHMLGLLHLKNIYWICTGRGALVYSTWSNLIISHVIAVSILTYKPCQIYTTQIIEYVEGFCSAIRIKIQIFVEVPPWASK